MAQCKFRTGELYNSKGDFLISISELSRRNPPMFNDEDQSISAKFLIEGAYIKFYDILVPVKGIAYKDVPIVRGSEEFTIEAHGEAMLLIKSDKMGVIKLITDVELKNAIDRIVESRHYTVECR